MQLNVFSMCSSEDFQNARETRQEFLRCLWKAFKLSVLRILPSPLLTSREVVIVKMSPPGRQCWLEGGADAKSILCLSFTDQSPILRSLSVSPASSWHSPCRSPSSHEAKWPMDPFYLTERGFSCFLLIPLFFCLFCLFTLTSVLTSGVTNFVTCTFFHPKNTLNNCAAWFQSFVWYFHLKQTSLVLPTQGCGIFC